MKQNPTRVLFGTVGLAAALAALPLTACNTDKLLTVPTPDVISPASLNDPAAFASLKVGAIGRLRDALSGAPTGGGGGEGAVLLGGLLTDEFRSSDTFVERNEIDQRSTTIQNFEIRDMMFALNRARAEAVIAINNWRGFVKNGNNYDPAELYFVEATAEDFLGEDFCSGVAFSSSIPGLPETYGTPLTTAQVYTAALAAADSGLALVGTATDANSTRVRNALNVMRGRILLNQGNFAQAAATVANVPTTFQYVIEHSQTTRDNQIWSLNVSARRYTVGLNDGKNGLPFATFTDPRVPPATVAASFVKAGGFDGTTDLYRQGLYQTRGTSWVLASGVEARLIEAEAALQAGNASNALSILNTLRSTSITIGDAKISGLQPLTLQATKDAQVTQLFNERAYWLFASGHRLGDMRRLVRQYGRDPETVYPTGPFPKGSVYGNQVAFPIPQAELNNPNYAAAGLSGCIDTKA